MLDNIIDTTKKEFKATFDYKKSSNNFIAIEPLELTENNEIEEELQIIVAAKGRCQ